MINLPIPAALNGKQLEAELKKAGLPSDFYAYAEEYLVFEADESQIAKIKEVLKAHVPLPEAEPTVEEKLQTAGLTLEELKAALA